MTSYVYQYHPTLPGTSQRPSNQFLSATFSMQAPEQISPGDHIHEEQIKVFEDVVILDLKEVRWTSFTDTNSMDPLLDETAHGLELHPEDSSLLQIGDIISYTYHDQVVIHRIVEIGYDRDGWYAITKGDNNAASDPHKVRFSQIKGVLVGILY